MARSDPEHDCPQALPDQISSLISLDWSRDACGWAPDSKTNLLWPANSRLVVGNSTLQRHAKGQPEIVWYTICWIWVTHLGQNSTAHHLPRSRRQVWTHQTDQLKEKRQRRKRQNNPQLLLMASDICRITCGSRIGLFAHKGFITDEIRRIDNSIHRDRLRRKRIVKQMVFFTF